MAERYTRLYSLPENQYTLGSPLLIAAGALLKDNQTGKALAQIKFKSISEKQIKAVKISITTFDVSGKELEGVAEYQYLDLNVARNTEFGQKQAVTLPNAVTRSFVVKCTNVFFTDDSVWSADSDAHWDALPKQATITDGLGSLAAQYQRDTSIRSKFVPAEHQDLWCCSCGALNHESEAECHACRQRKEKLFVALNLEVLDQRNEEYKAAEAEKAAKQAEANKIQSAKNKKLAVITAAVIAVIVVVRLLVTNVIIPNGHYKDAVALMEAGQYTEAIAAFEALDGYRNSENKIIECKTAILDGKYNEAIALMNAGKYEEAILMFYDLGGYKDSSQKITECITADRDRKYNDAIALMDAGNIVEAYEALVALDGYKDSTDKANSIYDKYKVEKLKVAKVGDYVFFGAYEQDNNTLNGKEDIEWLVLEVKNGKALVISKYALDCKQYNTSYTDVTWESCTLRKWLNNDFLGAAFSADEKAMIPTVTVSADKNPDYSTNPGNATQDQVFLLSITEANKYFSSNSARRCEPTDYAVANGVYEKDSGSGRGNCCWWLRSPGNYQDQAADVYYAGDFHKEGAIVHFGSIAVRPALWIDLSATK